MPNSVSIISDRFYVKAYPKKRKKPIRYNGSMALYQWKHGIFSCWVICRNEYTFFLTQQLDEVIIITSEFFNFKRKLKLKFPTV